MDNDDKILYADYIHSAARSMQCRPKLYKLCIVKSMLILYRNYQVHNIIHKHCQSTALFLKVHSICVPRLLFAVDVDVHLTTAISCFMWPWWS